jgi:polyhydroxyalkanoate synthesis regulator phasin
LEWGGGSEILATGFSGSYTLNTATLMDGAYSVVFTETVAGLTSTSRAVNLYSDNEAASLNQLVKTLNAELATDQATIASDAATISSLNGQVTNLTAQVSSLEAQLAASQGNTSAEQAQLANVEAQLTAAQQTIAQDQATITADQGQISAATANIATLNAKVTQLQNELNGKKGYVAPIWFDSIGSVGVIAIVVLVGALIGAGAYFAGRRRGAKSETPNVPVSGPSPSRPSNGKPAASATSTTGTEGKKAAMDDALAWAFRQSLVNTLQASVATQKTLLAEGRIEEARLLNARSREVGQEAQAYFR